jgi:hypothetical protein
MAHPAGAAYRARKYIRRHRIGAGVGPAAIATILVLAVVLALANFARHQNEIERIRWTLQQAIDNPNKWLDLLQPDWSHLESILHDEIRKNPHRDVALLAQRAACRVSVSAASFGRLSQGELHEEGLDEGLHDELGPGAVAPAQWWTGSPTFPSPALASASLAAASRACARVVGRHKAKLSISQADLPYQKEFRQLATKSSSRFMT